MMRTDIEINVWYRKSTKEWIAETSISQKPDFYGNFKFTGNSPSEAVKHLEQEIDNSIRECIELSKDT